jgi:hypothetical protein
MDLETHSKRKFARRQRKPVLAGKRRNFLLLNSPSAKSSLAASVTPLRKILWIGLACLALHGAARADILPPGNRAVPPGVHALVGGKVVVKPGQVLDSATVLIRDGLIEKVGANVTGAGRRAGLGHEGVDDLCGVH